MARTAVRPGRPAAAPPHRAESGTPGRSRLRSLLIALPFLVPSLIGVVVFLAIPVVLVVVYSFLRWNLLTSPSWAGFSNFTGIFREDHAAHALLITAYYVLLNIPLQTVLAICLALMLNRRLPAMGVFRTLYVVPYMATPVAMAVVWNWIFDPKLGAINVLLGHLGLHGPAWLSDSALAMPVIALINVWQYLGYNMLFFLAGLQAIPRHLYEAASIDGAGQVKQFFRITLPLLNPTLLFVLVTDVIGSFQIFDTVWVLTQGGPGNSTEVLNVSIYQTAFENFNIGAASAMSLVLFGVILLMTIIQFRFFRKRTVYEYV
jgi:multiple sugar transport system permease protein/sn-glycerol 3-phosphate transport system permease protein